MAIKLPLPAILLVSIIIYGCHKLCTPANYSLTGGVSTINPDKDSLRVGDTLWFNCSFSVMLRYKNINNNDSETIDLTGASNVVTDIHFNAIPKKDSLTEALDSFTITPSVGKVNINSLASDAAETVTFVQKTNNYDLSFGIVAQKKGIYVITILDIYQITKNCTKASVKIPLSSSINQHLYFLDSIYYPGSRYEPAIPEIELTHDYCFKVY